MESVLGEIKSQPTELLKNWYVKGINKRIFSGKFNEKISPEEAATRILEKVLKEEDKITMAKTIKVYGFHAKSKIHSFDPHIIAANAGYFSL